MQIKNAKPGKNQAVILFADDNDLVLDVGEQILQALGYYALMASTGQETIEVFKKNQNEVDLVILDIQMPDLSGVTIFEELKKIKSGVKVLVMSGNSQDNRIGELVNRGCLGFIPKPFTIKMLDQKISQNLYAHKVALLT